MIVDLLILTQLIFYMVAYFLTFFFNNLSLHWLKKRSTHKVASEFILYVKEGFILLIQSIPCQNAFLFVMGYFFGWFAQFDEMWILYDNWEISTK